MICKEEAERGLFQTNAQRLTYLCEKEELPLREWELLISTRDSEDEALASEMARDIAVQRFGKTVFLRGLIEISNICKNDCFYCGIRRSNTCAQRYRLEPEEILDTCQSAYQLGFRTFVLQGGEDGFWNDERMTELVRAIRRAHPDCAMTLSLGERGEASFQKLFGAGANRYLLRHETADPAHYEKLHPAGMRLSTRLECLSALKKIGYQTGVGMMIGSPYQTAKTLAMDMRYMTVFRPQMIGLGPFIPAQNTPFADRRAGTIKDTLFFLSLCRIACKDVLLPATTALGTIDPVGREKGILAGANVVMPNCSPERNRKKYMLYEGKIGADTTAADGLQRLKEALSRIGYTVDQGRGDYKARV